MAADKTQLLNSLRFDRPSQAAPRRSSRWTTLAIALPLSAALAAAAWYGIQEKALPSFSLALLAETAQPVRIAVARPAPGNGAGTPNAALICLVSR